MLLTRHFDVVELSTSSRSLTSSYQTAFVYYSALQSDGYRERSAGATATLPKQLTLDSKVSSVSDVFRDLFRIANERSAAGILHRPFHCWFVLDNINGETSTFVYTSELVDGVILVLYGVERNEGCLAGTLVSHVLRDAGRL